MVQQIANRSLHLFLERLVQNQLKLTGIFPVNSLWTLEDKQCINAYIFLMPFCSHAGYAKKGETNEWIQGSECRVWGAVVTHVKNPISVLWQIVHTICRQALTDTSLTGCTVHHFRLQILLGHWVILHKSKVLPWICPKAPATPSPPLLTYLQETPVMHPGFFFSYW